MLHEFFMFFYYMVIIRHSADKIWSSNCIHDIVVQYQINPIRLI